MHFIEFRNINKKDKDIYSIVVSDKIKWMYDKIVNEQSVRLSTKKRYQFLFGIFPCNSKVEFRCYDTDTKKRINHYVIPIDDKNAIRTINDLVTTSYKEIFEGDVVS